MPVAKRLRTIRKARTRKTATQPERRLIIEDDPDADLSWLDQFNTPETYKGNEILHPAQTAARRVLTFDEYMATYGNPENHVMLWARVEERCPTCGSWRTVDSLGNIDFIGYGAFVSLGLPSDFGIDWAVGTFASLDELPKGSYLRDVAKDMGFTK